MKFDRYTFVSLLCNLPFIVFGAMLTKSTSSSVLIFLLGSIAVSLAEVTFYDMLLSKQRRACLLYRIPFAVLFTVLWLCGWKTLIPFYVMGQFTVGTVATRLRFDNPPKKKSETTDKKKAAKPLLIAGLASAAMTTVCLIAGVIA